MEGEYCVISVLFINFHRKRHQRRPFLKIFMVWLFLIRLKLEKVSPFSNVLLKVLWPNLVGLITPKAVNVLIVLPKSFYTRRACKVRGGDSATDIEKV